MDLDRLAWRTSSYSADNGGSCVEVAPTPIGAAWRTSSFSGVNGNSCVEVAPLPEGVAVRDTKDRARAPHLHSAAAWRSFVTAVRNREFDRS
ncbi:DUF397 domain-containing protein [Pseudonocardia zijingensis]|uniref:DUF397 domain-containing protein n=1 Tax=Pseudonocardia zijingensis TaxID=153376 RepID=A0ABP4A6Y1_9PSEU